MRLLALHIAIFGCSLFVQAQEDSLKNNFLEEINLSDTRLQNLEVGHSTNNRIDSLLVGGHSLTFTELLFSNHSNHIRSYGPGLSATFSSRGSSSSQVNLYWNNLPLNSPGLGSTDIGLLPSDGFALTQVNGGGSTLYGNQAMGATVSVNQTPLKQTEIMRIGGGVGSFGKYFVNARGKIQGGKWKNSTAVHYQQAENDFLYAYRNQEYHRKNADVRLLNITNDLSYTFSENANLKFAYWGTFADRGSPSSYVPTAPASNRLEDQNHKVVVVYNQKLKTGVLTLTQGYLTEKQRFISESISELNTTQNVVTKVMYAFPSSKYWSFFMGADNNWTEAKGESKSNAVQNNFAVFGSVSFVKERFNTVLAVRQELIDAKMAPFSPSLALEYKLIRNLALIGNVSYNFRYPSLNDKYWSVGGNPYLLPEQGWNGEFGLRYSDKHFEIKSIYYKQNVENFIQWIPTAGNVWSPQNVKQVSIEGVESSLSFMNTFGKLNVHLSVGHLYNNSVIAQSSIPGDASIGKQLIYNPKHKFTASFCGIFKSLKILVGSVYTGDVYARADNSALSVLEQFNIFNMQASYRRMVNKTALEVHFSVLNFTNENYQTIKNYPMPGINFNTGITISI